MNIEQAEQAVSNVSSEMASRLQENLGNKITPELANGFLLSIRHVMAKELAALIEQPAADEPVSACAG